MWMTWPRGLPVSHGKLSDFEHVNVGSSVEHSVMDVAHMVARVVGFRGEIATNAAKPDGTLRKFMDSGRLLGIGWKIHTTLEEGLCNTYNDFLHRLHICNYLTYKDYLDSQHHNGIAFPLFV